MIIVKRSMPLVLLAAVFAGCALPNMVVFTEEELLEPEVDKNEVFESEVSDTSEPVDVEIYEEIVKNDSVVVLLWDAPETPVGRRRRRRVDDCRDA